MDLRNVFFHSGYPIDKIIGTFEGTFNAPGAAGVTQTTNTSFSTNIPERTFFQGIYSVDGGTNWLRFNNDYAPSSPISSELAVYGYSNVDTFTVEARNFTFSAASNFSVMYRVALIATPTQGDVGIQPRGGDVIFNSNDNYLKIIADESSSISLSAGGSTSLTYTHNLGYFCQGMTYFYLPSTTGSLNAGLYELDTILTYLSADTVNNPSNTAAVSSGLQMTTSQAIVSIKAGATGFSGTLYLRVYGDD